jgi:hypothetical protein
MPQFIAIQGTPADGFDHFGPFDTPEEAADYVQADYSRENWWIVRLTTPTSPDEIATDESRSNGPHQTTN